MKAVQIDITELKNVLQPFAALLTPPEGKNSGEYIIIHKDHNSVKSAENLIKALEFKYEIKDLK